MALLSVDYNVITVTMIILKTSLQILLLGAVILFSVSCEDYLPESNEPFDFTDSRDGNSYTALKIGDQTWMIKNLAYLPSVAPSSEGSESSPFYYVYDYQGTDIAEAIATYNYESYGVLYNWHAALTACPSGWHLPTETEWQTLEMHVALDEIDVDRIEWRGRPELLGTKLRSTSGWDSDGNGDNSSGFNALPAGFCMGGGSFQEEGRWATFWTSTEIDPPYNVLPWYRGLRSNEDGVHRVTTFYHSGFSVRCVKD